MKRVIFFLAACLSAVVLSAQTKLEFNDNADFSIRKGAFSFEPLSYFAFGDHVLFKAEGDMDSFRGNKNTEFFMNLIELRIHPYESGMFTLGVDLDWDYYRLDGDHFWQPGASGEKVSIAPLTGSDLKKIKKTRLCVGTISIPLAFEQSFGQFTLRLGIEGNYNSLAVSRFKGEDKDGVKVNEWKSGNRYSNQIKTNTLSYGFFGGFSYGGIGAYIKYSPMCQIADGYGPQFKSVSVGLVTGLGM